MTTSLGQWAATRGTKRREGEGDEINMANISLLGRGLNCGSDDPSIYHYQFVVENRQ